MPRRLLGCAVVAATVLALAGCGTTSVGGGEPVPGGAHVDGIRTTPDGHGLVVAYTGGSCDVSAKLEVDEHPDHVDVSVQVRATGYACDAAGHPRTVSAALASPLGARTVRADGHAIVVFDGGRLQEPVLPAGFTVAGESSPDDDGRRWSMVYAVPTDPSAAACAPGRGVLQVDEAPLGLGYTSYLGAGLTPVGTRTVGTTTATLFHHDDSTGGPVWALLWPAFGGQISLRSSGRCAGDQPFDGDELVRLAATLHPL